MTRPLHFALNRLRDRIDRAIGAILYYLSRGHYAVWPDVAFDDDTVFLPSTAHPLLRILDRFIEWLSREQAAIVRPVATRIIRASHR